MNKSPVLKAFSLLVLCSMLLPLITPQAAQAAARPRAVQAARTGFSRDVPLIQAFEGRPPR